MYNTNEAVTVFMNCAPIDAEGSKIARTIALAMLANGSDIPEDFADIFDIKIITRPSGSKYAVVNFA